MTRLTVLITIALSILLSGATAQARPIADSAFATVHTHTGFRAPTSLAVDTHGSVYVAAQGQNQIMELSPSGAPLQRFAVPGSCWISGVAVAPSSALYAISNCKGTVYRFAASGRILAAFGKPARFDALYRTQSSKTIFPSNVAVDHEGHVFVTYCGNSKAASSVQQFNAAGRLMRVVERGKLACPYSISVDREGYLYVGSNDGMSRIAPSGAITATFGHGTGLSLIDQARQSAVDSTGHLYIADDGNGGNAGVVMEFTTGGRFLRNVIHHGYSPNQVVQPVGLAIDKAGNLYMADYLANRIAKFSGAGKLLAVWQP